MVLKSFTAEIICERILNVIEEYDIVNRIISITFDNATSNTNAIKLIQKLVCSYTRGVLLYQRCACHIINLIVKSGIEILSIYIENVRNVIAYIYASNPRITEFKKYYRTEGLPPRKFQLDMHIRWNSVYLMLKNIIAYKNAITVFYNSKIGTLNLKV